MCEIARCIFACLARLVSVRLEQSVNNVPTYLVTKTATEMTLLTGVIARKQWLPEDRRNVSMQMTDRQRLKLECIEETQCAIAAHFSHLSPPYGDPR